MSASSGPFHDIDVWTRLRANQYPSRAERVALQAKTRRSRSELLRNTEDCAHFQSQLHSLWQKRMELEASIARCQSLCAPIRRVPYEILADIFSFCADENQITDTNRGIFLPGVDISLVCHHWHNVAKMTHALWTGFTVRISKFAGGSLAAEDVIRVQRLERAVRSLLARSETAPLDIRLEIEHPQDLQNPVIFALLATAERWRSLSLYLTASGFSDTFPNILANCLPILESVYIFTLRPIPGNGFSAFATAPNLKSWQEHILIDGDDEDEERGPLVPCNRITNLCLDSGYLRHLKALKTLKDLRTAKLCFRPDEDLSQFSDSISLPLLSSVELVAEGVMKTAPNAWTHVLDRLRIPKLESLTVSGQSEVDTSWPASSFTDFVGRSGCNLTFLKFEYLRMDAQSFLTSLKPLTSLTKLVYEDHWLPPQQTTFSTREILSAIFEPSTQFLPQLEHVELQMRCTDVVDEEIARLVLQRGRVSLRTFRLQMTGRDVVRSAYSSWKGINRINFHAEVVGRPGETAICSCPKEFT